MGLFDFFKCGGQSKAELRKVIESDKQNIDSLKREVKELREVISKRNVRIADLEGALQDAINEKNKQQSASQEMLRQKRAEIANLKKQLSAAHSIIDAREEDRKEPVEVLTELVPKRRRSYHRNSNGKFTKQEQEKAE